MKCPCMCRVSHGYVVCELENHHEGPHKDGYVEWKNAMRLTFTKPLRVPLHDDQAHMYPEAEDGH